MVDYIMIEALLERMKIAKSEYEFVLDEEDYCQYMQREEIRKLITQNNYKQAEELFKKAICITTPDYQQIIEDSKSIKK